MRKHFPILGYTAFVIVLLNGVVFWIVALCIGGDALSGKIVEGHYFVSSHGKLTEVSQVVWNYSRVHAISGLITAIPMGLFGAGFVIFKVTRKAV